MAVLIVSVVPFCCCRSCLCFGGAWGGRLSLKPLASLSYTHTHHSHFQNQSTRPQTTNHQSQITITPPPPPPPRPHHPRKNSRAAATAARPGGECARPTRRRPPASGWRRGKRCFLFFCVGVLDRVVCRGLVVVVWCVGGWDGCIYVCWIVWCVGCVWCVGGWDGCR